MSKQNRPLGPNESAVVLQGVIENMTPRQVLVRDGLVKDGVSQAIATELVVGLGVYFQLMKHREEHIEKMVAKGQSEKVARDFVERVGKATDAVLSSHPEISSVSCPPPEHLDQVIDRCAAGESWNIACEKVVEQARWDASWQIENSGNP